MSRQDESHVQEWASLLGEHVAEEALDRQRDPLSADTDGPTRPSGQ